MKIYFDLDGTLFDSKLRLYKLFQELIPQSNLTFEQYWNLKQNKVNHSTILTDLFCLSDKKICLFEQKWMVQIESNNYLQYDKPFEGVTEYLLSLKEREFQLYVLTARQFKEKVLTQLKNFELLDIFTDILVTEQKVSKLELLKSVMPSKNRDWIIGDTGMDIQTGKQLSINTAAVLTGFQNKKILLSYHPDLIVEKVVNFFPVDA